MSRTTSRIARGASHEKQPSTNVVLVRGRVVSAPTVRLVGRAQRVASLDVATVIHGRRSVVPVAVDAAQISAMKAGDDVTVLGHVRRRFFRVGSRTQSVTEIVAEQVVLGARSDKLDKMIAAVGARARETRTTSLPKVA